jgi:hypothetical protein
MNTIIIKIIAGLAFLSITAYGVFIYSPAVNVVSRHNVDNQLVSDHRRPLIFSESGVVDNSDASPVDSFIKELSAKMKNKHAHEIHSVVVQLTMVDFRLFVLEEFPQNGDAIFQRIMNNAFPDYAQKIFDVLSKMAVYSNWHVDMLLTLNDMNPVARKGTLWGKRRELFSDLADEIWQSELDDAEQKETSIQETLAALNVAKDMPMSDRLYMLSNSIQEQYGDEHSSLLISKGMVTDIFFHLDSVQNDLKNMTELDRNDALAASRRQLGFSEASIEEMSKKDQENEVRWKNGSDYMSERDQLTKINNGKVLTEKLAKLRIKYFKHEAPTIEIEEQTEFFRYKRPRLYGSN